MNLRPNAYQKLVHRLLMLRPVSAFLSVALHRADRLLLWITKGKYAFTRIVGLPVVQLTTQGARTGQWRTVPLVGVVEGETIALIASNFGGRHAPGWYYNLKANPECEVKLRDVVQKYLARETAGAEYHHYWMMAISLYVGYEEYRKRAAPRHIPVMVLEPKK